MLEILEPMIEGISISVGIIENLKSYSEKDKPAFAEVDLKHVVKTVMGILKSNVKTSEGSGV